MKLSPSEITFWQQVVIAVASSSNAPGPQTMSAWADRAVTDLRERLKGEEDQTFRGVVR